MHAAAHRFALFVVAVSLGTAPCARATTWTVAPDGSGDFPTIQAAVDFAGSGDEILLEDGTFVGGGNHDVNLRGKALTIRSAAGAPDACVIDCQDALVSAFVFAGGETQATAVEHLTIVGARGPALAMSSASPTIRGVVLRSNHIPAVDIRDGAPLISTCLFEANTLPGSNAKGVLHAELAMPTVEDTRFLGNGLGGRAADACITCLLGTATVQRCDFSGNGNHPISIFEPASTNGVIEDCASDRGGIILHTSYGTADFAVRRCTFENASVGVVVSGASDVTVEDCEILACGTGYRDEFSTGSSTLRNTLVESCGNGMFLGGASADVQGCTIRGSSYTALRILNGAAAEIRDCEISGNGVTAINSWSSGPVAVERCTLASNGRCCGTFAGGIVAVGTGPVSVRETILWGGCRFDGTLMDVFVQTGASVDLACVILDPSRVGGPGTVTIANAIAEDPLFCSPLDCAAAPTPGGVYVVAADSPALSQTCGTIGVPGPTCDVVGVEAGLRATSWGQAKAEYRGTPGR